MLQYQLNSSDNKQGATMIELMAMLAILGLGVTAMFSVITSGIYFAKDTEDTIKAINLAREGIEGVTNIRNTNWLRFSSDRINCWKVQSYDQTCIGYASPWLISIGSGSNILYTTNGLWYLSGTAILDSDAAWPSYAQTYATIQDSNSSFNQTGSMNLGACTSELQKNCKTIFTREIAIDLPANPSESGSLFIKSIVRWKTTRVHKVELSTTLTNWKAKF